MTTTTELSENSHQGFEGLKAALCLASMDAKSNTASRMQPCLRRNRTGSRCSGKERDETGLDFFLARYYSGAQGRFTSPDKPIMDQHIGNPQSWNLYAYARNNPLLFTDPTGEKIELIGDFWQRFASWYSLLSVCGGCEFQFDEDLIKQEGRYVIIGILGADAEIPVVKDLIDLIEHNEIVEFALTSEDLSKWSGAVTYKPGKDGDNKYLRVLVNPSQMKLATDRLSPDNWNMFFKWEGQDPKRFKPAYKVRDVTTLIAVWHEFGHAFGHLERWKIFQGMGLPNGPALDWENRMREHLYGPLGEDNAKRIGH